MKKLIPVIIALFATSVAVGQSVNDVVSLGAGYANQVWYSLENDEQGTSPKSNWDLAFKVSAQGSSIHINPSVGTELWVYPNGDTADWASVDTTGINGWEPLYNSETSWNGGAFDMTANPNDPFDLGWGTYDMITHHVVGDSVYVIKLGNGQYQKFWIERLASGTYYFRHATLDNNMDMSHNLMKANYSGKNFGYYSLQNHSALDREPANNSWDLTFTQYTSILPGFGGYLVTGVLHNDSVEAVKVHPVNDPTSYNDYQTWTFNSEINELGYDWKSFNMQTFQFDIEDSTVYFVKDLLGSYWKIIFTGFGGSTSGDFEFTKEKVSSVGIGEQEGSFFSVYPNPAREQLNIVLDTQEQVEVALYSLSGQRVYSEALNQTGFRTEQLTLPTLTSGLYILQVQGSNWGKSEKISIQ